MTAARWERISALTGIAFALLMVLAFTVQGVLPQADDPPRSIVEFFAENDGGVMAGILIRLVAGVFFLWFVGTLRVALARAEGESGRLAAVAFGAGVMMLAAGLGAMAALAAIAYRAELVTSPELTTALISMTHIFFVGGAMAMAWLLTATFIVVLRTRVFPAWLGWFGLAVAIISVVVGVAAPGGNSGVSGYPLFILWVVAVSVLLFRRPESVAEGPAPA